MANGVDPIDSAVSTLAMYLAAAIPGLTVLQEWPTANQELKMPSLTVTSGGKPKRTPLMPEIISLTPPNKTNQVTANEIIAEWDDTFQLDLWCGSKPERRQFTDAVIAAFNAQQANSGDALADGLSLPMPDNFNDICRYDIDTVWCVDDEASAQRNERREKFSVLVNFREIRQRTYYAILRTQIEVSVATSEAALEDPANSEDFSP